MRNGTKFGAALAVIGILVAGLGVIPASAAVPTMTAPGRVYTGPGVPIAFDGATPDPISGDTRGITLVTDDDDADCAPTAANSYTDVGGCAALDLTVSHGTLTIPISDDLDGDPSAPDSIAVGGAIIASTGVVDGNGVGPNFHINGTDEQLQVAVDALLYTPDPGYEFQDFQPEELFVRGIDGDTSESKSLYVQIRVLDINDFPTVTGPAASKNVAAGGIDVSPPVAPPDFVGEWTVEDDDVDDPIADEGALGTEMMLISFATCGTFSLLPGSFTAAGEIEDVLDQFAEDELGITDQATRDIAIGKVMELLPDEVKNKSISSTDPSAFNEVFVGIGERDEIEYALSQVQFQAPSESGTCDFVNFVTDLGHNGLPFSYLGTPANSGQDDPEAPVPGVEIPLPGVGWDQVTYIVGEGVTVSLPTTLTVVEGQAVDIPVSVSSANHPAFTVDLDTTDLTTSSADYDPATTPVSFPESAAGPVNSSLQSAQDADPEDPDEIVNVAIDPTTLPEGITVDNGTVAITILDDGDVIPVDTTDPSVTIDQGASQTDPTSISPIVFDVVFDEPVTGFTDTDVDLTASTAGGTLVATVGDAGDADAATYLVSVSGMTTDGDVVASIPANAAQDAALNDSNASTSTDNTVAWEQPDPGDIIDPSVTIDQGTSQVDPTSISPIVFDVLFDEPVTGFTDTDVDLSASTAGGTLVATVGDAGDADPATYVVSVSGMTTDGDVVASIPANAAQDSALNDSNASTSTDNTVAWEQPDPGDIIDPSVTIDQAGAQPDPTGVAPIYFSVLFDEPVTGFTDTDVDLTASTAGGTLTAVVTDAGDADPATYMVAVSGMTTDGNVIATIPANAAQDAALNDSNASTSTDNTVAWEQPDPGDIIDPSVTIDQGTSQVDPTSISPIVFDVLFDEPVTGFTDTDVDLSASTAGGTLVATVGDAGDADPATYVVSVSGMTTDGDVVASIPANAAQDSALNDSNASTSTDNTVAWEQPDPGDIIDPSVTIDQGTSQVDPTSISPIVFDVLFDEPVTGFTDTDVVLSASTAGGLLVAVVGDAGDADAATYLVSVSGMTTAGVVIATIPANAAQDAALNDSNASTSTDNTVTWVEPVDPLVTVTIDQAATQADPTSESPIEFTVVFNVAVATFGADDVDLSTSTAGGSLVATVTGSGTTYTVAVTGMTTSGDVVATIPAGDIQAADNSASTSTDNVVTWVEPSSASSTTTTTGPTTTTTGSGDTTSTTAGPAVGGSGQGQGLPRTGLDLAWPGLVGFGLVAVGTAELIVARRRRQRLG